MSRPAAFLDRDGVIIEDPGHLHDVGQVALIPGAAAAIRRVNDSGYASVVITNQSVVARGLCDEAQLRAIHDEMIRRLDLEGARLDAIYYCPHHPEIGEAPYRQDCDCRKPKPGLLLRAAVELDLDLAASAMIGDGLRDLEAGRRAGCGHTALVLTGWGQGEQARITQGADRPDFIAADLGAAVANLLDGGGKSG